MNRQNVLVPWALLVVALPRPVPVHADIDRWENSALIQDAEGAPPLAGVAFDNRHVELANLSTYQGSTDFALVRRLPANVLRSAFYLRATGRDRAAPAATLHELNEQLQRHFDVVLAALAANGERSLDVALQRLEESRGRFWTDDERAAWRQTLADRRALNVRRLRAYQLRGLFPQNEHSTSRAVPIFVDHHDTACAVGHLMRESGWGDGVAAIQRANNFVYVTDVRDGPLAEWVLVSGLTQEEAALIQPMYGPQYTPPPFDEGLDRLTQGGSITKNGLRFSNFRFIAGELADPDSFPQVPPPVNQIDLTGYGAAAGENALPSINHTFDDWLFVGARQLNSLIFYRDSVWGVLYSYDVAAVDPDNRLVAASLENGLAFGNLDFKSWIYPSGTTEPPALAHLNVGNVGARWFGGKDSASFAPQQKLSVVTAVKLVESPAALFSIVHSFHLVPEPAAAILGLFALVGLRGLACQHHGRPQACSFGDSRLVGRRFGLVNMPARQEAWP